MNDTDNATRYCPCGKQGPFRSDKAVRCVACDEVALSRRRNYARDYHAARARAVSRLIKAYHPLFEVYLEQERAAG